MLTEHSCRLLANAAEILMEDFDPADAVHHFEAKSIFTQDQAESIEKKHTRVERLRDFLRYYRRQADTLEPLKAYFERSCQPQIVRYLNEENITLDMSSLQDVTGISSKEKKLRKLQLGFVPFSHRHVRRQGLFDHLEELLKRRAQLDNFIVGLSGCAGSGKTSLIADLLFSSNDLIDGCFEHVYFVRDSNIRTDRIRNVFSELLLLLKDNTECMPPVDTMNLATTDIIKQIVSTLIDRPNALIIIDDVHLVETVRWVDQLKIRCLITTRNSDLLAAVGVPVDVINVSGLNYVETEQFVCDSGDKWNTLNKDHLTTIARSFKLTSGNVALLGKLCKISAGRPGRFADYLDIISASGFSCLNCITSYQHNSIFTTMSQSVSRMSESDKTALSSCAVLPADIWIPIEILALIIPVDITDTDSVKTLVIEQLNRLMNSGSWVEENVDDEEICSFRVPSFVTLYLLEAVQFDVIQYLSHKILEAANNTSVDVCVSQISFFEEQQEWLSNLRENVIPQSVSVTTAENDVYSTWCSLM